jgi:hypothetical protein
MRSYFVALLGCGAGLLGAFVAYTCLGAATNVFHMQLNWWVRIYNALALVVPLAGIWAGVRARQSYLWRQRGKTLALGQGVRGTSGEESS